METIEKTKKHQSVQPKTIAKPLGNKQKQKKQWFPNRLATPHPMPKPVDSPGNHDLYSAFCFSNGFAMVLGWMLCFFFFFSFSLFSNGFDGFLYILVGCQASLNLI